MDFNETYIRYLGARAFESVDNNLANKQHQHNMQKLKAEFVKRSEAERLRNERKKLIANAKTDREKHSKFLQVLSKLKHE